MTGWVRLSRCTYLKPVASNILETKIESKHRAGRARISPARECGRSCDQKQQKQRVKFSSLS